MRRLRHLQRQSHRRPEAMLRSWLSDHGLLRPCGVAYRQPGKTQEGIEVGCRHLLFASDIVHGQLGVLDQTRLDVVRASQDSEQAGIGWCLVIGIFDQHSHFATDALQAHGHRQSQEIIQCTRRRLMRRGLLCGMGRRHRVAVGIDHQARQQTRRLRPHRQRVLAPIGGELVLHDLPKLRIEDGLVLARVGFALVNNVAPIKPVLQHQVEGAAGKMLAAGQPSATAETAETEEFRDLPDLDDMLGVGMPLSDVLAFWNEMMSSADRSVSVWGQRLKAWKQASQLLQ
jgi:hypothetical protein